MDEMEFTEAASNFGDLASDYKFLTGHKWNQSEEEDE
jgi:hypothetical protein